jgi:ferredoxin
MPGNWRTRSWAATHEVSVSRQRSPIFLQDYTPEDASRVDFLMTTAVIVGSGAAAAGAALALSTRPDIQITVLDLGARLEPEKQHVLDRLSVLDQEHWPDVEMASVVGQPVRSSVKGLPEKRTFGSDFPFRDVGQLMGLTSSRDVNRSVVSGAYGGFSNVWGAQVMPFSAAVFDSWAMSVGEFEWHYKEILRHLPFAAEDDDLADLFPLLGQPHPLPEVSSRTRRVLQAYDRNRPRLNKLGIAVGKARLAFDSRACVRCGRCMTGCPYSLIYSASQTFDELRRSDRVTYHGGLLVLKVAELGDKAVVTAKDPGTGQIHRFEADRVYLACGAVGSTRIVVNSLDLYDRDVAMHESQQFTVPMLSRRSVPDPRSEPTFTLNQFNMTVALDDAGFDLAQIHFYTHNEAFIQALPQPLRLRLMEPVMVHLLRRLTVAIGYLPSWHSPRLRLRGRRASNPDDLPELFVSRDDPPWLRNAFARTVLRRTLRAAPLLDLYPILPELIWAAGGKSYHWGGTFPYTQDRRTIFSSDRVGRVGLWKRVHLVDAAVFPTVPATTYMLTVMANSHRIASESMQLSS